MSVRIERRLSQPRWLSVAVPLGSVAFAFVAIAIVLAATGHNPAHTFAKLFRKGGMGAYAFGNRSYRQPPLVFRNTGTGDGTFRDVTSGSGADMPSLNSVKAIKAWCSTVPRTVRDGLRVVDPRNRSRRSTQKTTMQPSSA